ncbi:MAG: hypothetical protein LCH90_11000 [Proteobacteria bacterium]|nr:hypothetical protein [Pseudomonadota bacterium]
MAWFRKAPLLVWAGTKGEEAAPLAAARAARRRRQFDEYRRLLYVAMTRAADRLYIGGFADNRAKSDGSSSRSPNPPGEMNWHELVSEGLADWERMEDIEVAEPEGTTRRIRRLRPEAAIVPAMPLPPPVPAEDAPLPGWLLSPLAPDAEPLPPLKPSRGAAATGATPAEETPEGDFRRRRGILVFQPK